MRTVLLISMLSFALMANGKEKPNYIDYHKQIIVAEQQFLYHQNLEEAFQQYERIFKEWRPFAKDCYIAMQLACMVNDTARATYFFQKCFETGVEWNTLLVSPHVQRVFATDISYRKMIEKLSDKYSKLHLQTIDTTWWNIINNMYEHEYGLRRIAELKNDEKLKARWLEVEDSNMYELVRLVKKQGFPGEKRIGKCYLTQVDINKDPSLTSIKLSCHSAVLFFHHRCGYELLKEELMQAVKDGELHPREYGLIYEWSHAHFSKTNWFDEYIDFKCTMSPWDKHYNLYLLPWFHSNDIEQVNKDRVEIGISSLEHDKRKTKYAEESDLYLWFGQFKKI